MGKVMVRNNEILTTEVEPEVQAAWENEWLNEKYAEIDSVLKPFGVSVLDIKALPPLRRVVYEED